MHLDDGVDLSASGPRPLQQRWTGSRVPSTPSVLATIAGVGDHFMAVNVGSTRFYSTRTNAMVMVDGVGKLGQGPKSHNFSTGLYNNSKLRACFRGRCATIQG